MTSAAAGPAASHLPVLENTERGQLVSRAGARACEPEPPFPSATQDKRAQLLRRCSEWLEALRAQLEPGTLRGGKVGAPRLRVLLRILTCSVGFLQPGHPVEVRQQSSEADERVFGGKVLYLLGFFPKLWFF